MGPMLTIPGPFTILGVLIQLPGVLFSIVVGS